MLNFLAIISIMLSAATALAQETGGQDLFSQAAQLAGTGTGASSGGMIAGFDVAGLIGAMLFGAVGFVAFMYGKKMAEFKPMLIGIGLLAYPYFIKNTLGIYAVGIVLSVCLYFFRE